MSNKNKKKTINLHHDSDGLVAAYMVSFAYPNAKFICPDDFGDTEGMKEGDIMVDMKPKDPNKKIKVIDHHPGQCPG